MTQNQMLITIIIISSCFFIGSLMLDHGKWIVNMLIRGCVGLIFIGLMNQILNGFDLYIPVGINVLNFVIASVLGIPGIFSLYGIGLWQIFF